LVFWIINRSKFYTSKPYPTKNVNWGENVTNLFYFWEKHTRKMTLIDLKGNKIGTVQTKPTHKQFSNAHLFQYMREYFEQRGTLNGMLNRSKYAEFYKNNHLRYDSLMAEMEKIELQYFVMEEDTESERGIKRKIVTTEVEGKEKKAYVFLEGLTVEDYNNAINELMKEPTVILW
jgi:hypothetical protein